MIARSAPSRAAAKWIVITSAVIALACTPAGGFPPPLPDWSTPLPTGVDLDAATFRARVDNFPLSGNPHTRARAATCRPGSLDPHGSPRVLCAVEVKIEALGDTRLIDPDNAPAMGAAVARIENLDTEDTEAKFGFRPGIQDVYYLLWVDRQPGSAKARWTILQVPTIGGSVRAGQQQDLKRCHYWKPTDPLPVSDADFYEYKYDDQPCDAAVSAEKSGAQQASFLPIEQFAAIVGRVATFFRGEFTAAGGGWISCSGGCCT